MNIDTSAVVEGVENVTHDHLNEASRRWFAGSQNWLEEAAEGRATVDRTRDSRGPLEVRENQGLWKIHQSGQPPHYDEARDAFVFVYTHFSAVWHEFGTEPHEIWPVNAEALAFEWPDAPDSEVAKFTPGGEDEVNRHQWDGWVFYGMVNHPGNPAIGYVRRGRDDAIEFLEGLG